MQKIWLRIQFKPIQRELHIKNKKKGKIDKAWVKPKEGWVRVNFDGAAQWNPGPLGAGVIVRDEHGEVLAVAARKLHPGTNNVAEAKEAALQLRIALALDVKRIHLEGNSLLIIQSISNMNVTEWHMKNYRRNPLNVG